jgi:hypothetical protein
MDMWDDALEVYLRKTRRSKEFFEAAKRVFCWWGEP